MTDIGPGLDEVLLRAKEAFRAAFEREPSWAAAAPGRVNLIGEHTDYNDGFVLPMAIDRWTVAVAGPAAGRVSRIIAVELGERAEVALTGRLDPREFSPGAWVSYVAGVAALMQTARVRPFQSPTGPERARPSKCELDIAIASSVPVGSGLASSAALEVSVATLLERVWDAPLDPRDKAALCRRAEQEFAGVPCGLMDQFISACAREGHATFLDCRTGEGTPVPMPPRERLAVVIADSRVRHALASGEYAARRSTCVSAAAKLGVRALRDATSFAAEARRGVLTQEELRAARHVTGENVRTLAAADALRAGDLVGLGRLMAASHASLRDDFRVSCPELDTLVDVASGMPGAYGARMTGGGFGGCAVLLCDPGAVPPLQRELTAGYRARHGRECGVMTTVAVGAARPIDL